MTQSTQKLQGTFFRLTTDDLLFLTSKLTDAELKVYLYLKTLNPFTDNFKELDTAQIAEHLDVKRRTAQRFIKKFQELGLIDWIMTRFKYRTNELENDPAIAKRSYDRQSDRTIALAIVRSPKRSYDRLSDPTIAMRS